MNCEKKSELLVVLVCFILILLFIIHINISYQQNRAYQINGKIHAIGKAWHENCSLLENMNMIVIYPEESTKIDDCTILYIDANYQTIWQYLGKWAKIEYLIICKVDKRRHLDAPVVQISSIKPY